MNDGRICRLCATPLPGDAVACPACGATTAAANTANTAKGPPAPLIGIGAGIGLGILLAALTFALDSAFSRDIETYVVYGTYVAIGLLFVAGIGAFAARRVLLGFILITAGIVVVLPAFAFGTIALNCMNR